MSGLEGALAALLARLAARRVRFAIVGGLAVSARTEPRFTRDADIAVAVASDREAEALVQALQADGYTVVALVEQVSSGRIATVRLGAPEATHEGIALDLLFASSGIEAEVVAGAEDLELFDGVRVPIASTAALIALKVLARDDARRPQDRVDLVALLAVASARDLGQARGLLSLIGERGYARGRDLLASLDAIRAELGG